ncbi:MAG TPA: hypothetical protein VEI07_20605 [Planctomycetaceae bacterium]|nr:hypothetical protein [Planctomycetaceae bacterium]
MMFRNLAVVAFVAASFVGCDIQNTPAKKSVAPVAEKAQTDEKTPDDARNYMQEQIDRYLGGQRTDKQLMKLDPTGEVTYPHIGDKINSITITNVLPAYSKEGEKQENAFKVSLVFTGDKWTKTVERHVMYEPKMGGWVVL